MSVKRNKLPKLSPIQIKELDKYQTIERAEKLISYMPRDILEDGYVPEYKLIPKMLKIEKEAENILEYFKELGYDDIYLTDILDFFPDYIPPEFLTNDSLSSL